MTQYILEYIAFQLAFLVIYDFFLKRETFFQWNRAYLIATYVLSMILPWIKIEALKTAVPEQYYVYPEFLWKANTTTIVATGVETSVFEISWQEGVLYGGMLLAAFYFGYKLYRLQQLRAQGTIVYFSNFTRVVVKNSELAFSFFKSIFLGDKVLSREHKSIIQH
ncbi:MAG: bla regulator protein BlaR1 [Maribacter sp.]|jgi:bla regulator protein BlaR1